jgi:Isopentenyldiphosphate isomerase
MELLDIVDERGIPTGETVERTVAHEKGIMHRTSHVWILRKNNSKVEILLQKRSKNKDSYPSCYDISSAGHIPAGVDFIPSALRELEEELGIEAHADELMYCGQRRFRYENEFHGKGFVDNQVSNVYIIWKAIDENKIKIQETELESVIWMDFEECMEKVENNQIKHCIKMEELEMIKEAILKK